MSKATIPPIDDFIMQILGMSEAQYHGDWIIGWSQYNERRPCDWPTAFVVLRFYGFAMSANGWREFVQAHIGGQVVTPEVHRQMQAQQRYERRSPELKVIPDYTGQRRDGEYEALSSPGLQICKDTYQKTGRMFLR